MTLLWWSDVKMEKLAGAQQGMTEGVGKTKGTLESTSHPISLIAYRSPDSLCKMAQG